MTSPTAEQQLVRLASDNGAIYKDAWRWFLAQGPAVASVLVRGLKDSGLGSVCHWRILLVLRELALPSTLPAILERFRLALEQRDPIVLPGAMEALSVFKTDDGVAALGSVLQRGEIDDMKHAASLLGDMGGDVAVKSLAAFLNHPQAGVRKSAVKALLKANTPSAREALKQRRRGETDPDVLALINSMN